MRSDTFSLLQLASCVKLSIMLSILIAFSGLRDDALLSL